MLGELRELWKFRELLISMVQRELKIRYKNSFLGFLWSLVTPLVTTLVLTIVFKYFGGFDIDSYSAYVLAALLPFTFFQQGVLDSAQSVLAALPVVKKVYFPREILPLATIISNFVHFVLALLVLFAFLLVVWALNPGIPPFRWTIIYLPLLMVVTFALTTGVGLLVAALNTFYEDTKYAAQVLLYLLFYLCPVIYFSELVYYKAPSQAWYVVYHLNPMATMVTTYRKVILPPQDIPIPGRIDPAPALGLNPWFVAFSIFFSFGMLVFGYWVFNRLKWRFVERP